jgi:hypothetical protein
MDEENREWQEPPLPEEIRTETEPPQMSEIATLGNIFIEPGRTFEDLRRKPRFILAILLTIIGFSAFQILFVEKIGFEKIMRGQLENNSRMQQLPADQRQQIIEQQTKPSSKYISYATTPIFLIIGFFAFGLLYFLGAKAMGGTIGYLQGVSIWAYSTFAPWIIWEISNILVLFLKNVDEIDLGSGRGGLVNANPTMFLDVKGHPALGALLSTFDLFVIFGWVLAAIGLHKVARLSKGAAWAVVLIVALTWLTIKIVWLSLFG